MEKLEQLIIGSMLGDGYLDKISHTLKNSRLSIAHSLDQKEYCEFKHSILQEFDLAGKLCYNKIEHSRYKNGYIEECRFRSKTNVIFTRYRNLFYKENKKILHKQTINNINPLGLAIWFMDDGSKLISGYILCTHSFTESEVKYLRKLLKSKFKINTTCQQQGNVIYINKSSVELFDSIIDPYIVNSMKYKLHKYKVLNKQGELLENPTTVIVNEDNQQPSLDSNIFEGSTTNNQILIDNAKDSNVNKSALPIKYNSKGIWKNINL